MFPSQNKFAKKKHIQFNLEIKLLTAMWKKKETFKNAQKLRQ